MGACTDTEDAWVVSGALHTDTYSYHFNDAMNTYDLHESFHEHQGSGYSYTYGAAGAFGPGGEQGVYTSEEDGGSFDHYAGSSDSSWTFDNGTGSLSPTQPNPPTGYYYPPGWYDGYYYPDGWYL